MYLLGYDIGSSSVKVSLVDAKTNMEIKTLKSPEQEMSMICAREGWAEQDPDLWWRHVCHATRQILQQTGVASDQIAAIGISYQMHGLVVVDSNQQVLRPAIIWCDSRAVDLGTQAFESIGKEKCLKTHMNSPGNFTASKLAWIKLNEPEIYDQIDKIMLPGDYISMKLSGCINTTISGLSEGILWDYQDHKISTLITEHYGINKSLIPDLCDTIGIQSRINSEGAQDTGLMIDTPICYRAGDQPNNALSLGVLEPGQVAATGGTSGVVYGVINTNSYDPQSRVNNFAHVNYSKDTPNVGVLLCINGTGIAYNHIRQLMGGKHDYDILEALAAKADVGSQGLVFLPFGNGTERILNNKEIGAVYSAISFNRHNQEEYIRATIEGIAFSFVYGIEIMKDLGLNLEEIKAGNDNMFQSALFAQSISDLTSATIRIVETTGAIGAARASGVGVGLFKDLPTAMNGLKQIKKYKPNPDNTKLKIAYNKWLKELNSRLMN